MLSLWNLHTVLKIIYLLKHYWKNNKCKLGFVCKSVAWYCHTVGASVSTIVACVYTKNNWSVCLRWQGCVSIWTIRAYFYTNVIWYCHLFAQSNHSSLFHSFVFRITTIFALHSFVNRSSENIICVRGYITTNILYINTQTNVNKIYTSIFFVTVALIWWNNN